MGGVDAQFAEDVFAVGGDGVDAGETFGSNLLGRLALSDGADYLRLRLGQDAGTFFLNLLLVNDNLCRSESPEQIRVPWSTWNSTLLLYDTLHSCYLSGI